MKRNILVLMGTLVLLTTNHVWAEGEKKPVVKYDLGEVIVVATKREQYQAEVGSSTTVITAEEIKKKGKMTVLELLRTVPGIDITQSGGRGAFTVLRLRGGEPGYTMVMIDGVEVKYLMEMDGGFFDFAHLTTDNIERIEIVRGPQSTLYGSSAMSGVINIITKKGVGKAKFNLQAEMGAYNTSRALVSIGGSTEEVNYSLSYSHIDTEGISSAAGGVEDDGCKINNISGRLGFKISNDSELSLILGVTNAETDIDDGANQDDPNYTIKKKMFTSQVQFTQSLTPSYEHKITLSSLSTKRDYQDR